MYDFSGMVGRRFKVTIFFFKRASHGQTMKLEWSNNGVDGNDLEAKSCVLILLRKYKKLLPLRYLTFFFFLMIFGGELSNIVSLVDRI